MVCFRTCKGGPSQDGWACERSSHVMLLACVITVFVAPRLQYRQLPETRVVFVLFLCRRDTDTDRLLRSGSSAARWTVPDSSRRAQAAMRAVL
jgi:hypothetical protein